MYRHLIKTYRDLCQEEEEVTKDLFAALDSSSFKDKEKLVKFDANEYQRICQGKFGWILFYYLDKLFI